MSVQINPVVAGSSQNTLSTANVSLNTGISGNSQVSGGSEALQTSLGSFTFTGPAGRFALNHQTVWHPLLANMPAFAGARPVVNWIINSDTPGSPTAWTTVAGGEVSFAASTDTYNGRTIGVIDINNNSTTGGPYIYGYSGNWFGATVADSPYATGQWATVNGWAPGTMMVARAALKLSSGAITDWVMYQRAKDNNVAPTESQGGYLTLTSDYQIISGLMEQNAGYTALGTRFNQNTSGALTHTLLGQPQVEDLSGDKGPYTSSEYVPSFGASPGWKWFGTAKNTTRTNNTYLSTWTTNVVVKNPSNSTTYSCGVLTEDTGTALTGLNGVVMEPAASNIAGGWNTLAKIGQFKSSGSATPASGVPYANGATTIYYEAPSGMMVGNYNGSAPTDITLNAGAPDTITSTTTNFVTAGFTVGMSIWVWRADAYTSPVLLVAGVAANTLTLTGSLLTAKASGTATRIMRCPTNGDNIMLMLNDGTGFRTTVNATVTLPAAGAWSSKNYVTVSIANALPSAGGWAATDNGTHGFYWKDHTDFGISIAGGTGVTCKPVFDKQALIDAGLGYLCPMGLALEIYGGSGATTTVALAGTSALGTATRDTRISVYAKKISGTDMRIKLENGAHTNFTALSGASWARYTCTESSLGTQNIPTISNVTAGSTTYVILWQTEQASDVAANQTGVTSSPIVTFGDTAAKTRTATKCFRSWNSNSTNNIGRSLVWTPAYGALVQKQVLWALYQDASNYLELSISNTTITWRKRRAGTNFDVTASYTPVAGTPCNLVFNCRSDSGMTLSVDGVAATPNITDLYGITALTTSSVEEIGTANSANGAYGAFRALQVL